MAGLLEPLRNNEFLAAVLFLGVPSSLFTALLLNYALARLEAYKISVCNNLATVIAMAAGYLILGEDLQWHHIVGAAAIIAGVIGTARRGRAA